MNILKMSSSSNILLMWTASSHSKLWMFWESQHAQIFPCRTFHDFTGTMTSYWHSCQLTILKCIRMAMYWCSQDVLSMTSYHFDLESCSHIKPLTLCSIWQVLLMYKSPVLHQVSILSLHHITIKWPCRDVMVHCGRHSRPCAQLDLHIEDEHAPLKRNGASTTWQVA